MKKVLLITLVMMFVMAGAAFAQNTHQITVTANIAAVGKLTVDQTTLTFDAADPDGQPSVPANEGALNISAKVRGSSSLPWRLTVVASGVNMTSGSNTIPVNRLTWTVTGAAYVAGTVGAVASNVATQTGSGTYDGTQTYAMVNDWAYATGAYTTTLTYTLIAV